MRYNITKKKSTYSERVFYEILKQLNIPFKHRWLLNGIEVDFFLWDKVCIEIDGHEQDVIKNNQLIALGYIPIHFHNKEITNKKQIINLLINLQKNVYNKNET